MSKKEKKERSENYEQKLKIEGTFDDVLKASVKPSQKDEKDKG